MQRMKHITQSLFLIDVMAHYVLLVGVAWSIFLPPKRAWPPPQKRSWQHAATWILFYLIFAIHIALIFLDWNSWVFKSYARLFLGIPLVLIGSGFLYWGILTLGVKNTSGVKDGFINTGPYRYTRNPQYLGDAFIFLGMILVSNSFYVLITHALTIFVFLLAPLTEEVWLEEKYGSMYLEYKRNTTRFI